MIEKCIRLQLPKSEVSLTVEVSQSKRAKMADRSPSPISSTLLYIEIWYEVPASSDFATSSVLIPRFGSYPTYHGILHGDCRYPKTTMRTPAFGVGTPKSGKLVYRLPFYGPSRYTLSIFFTRRLFYYRILVVLCRRCVPG
jgi:hypothetical protein